MAHDNSPIYLIEGHAIVSGDGAIADASGAMPCELRIEADWVRFQRHLDEAALTVLGRASHEAAPNPGRRRMVITTRSGGLERSDIRTWAFNPDRAPIGDVLKSLAPRGGRIAVVGGTAVFDLFLDHGFDAFHLTVVEECRLPGGRPVFTGIASAGEAMDKLEASGLELSRRTVLDEAAGAVLHLFTRPGGSD